MFLINIRLKKYDEAVDHFLPTLNFVPGWFVTIKMFKKTFGMAS